MKDADLSALQESIRACSAEETFDRETQALLRMLERPAEPDAADRIIHELDTPPAPVLSAAPPEQASGRLRHPVMAVMLLIFLVLLTAAIVVICSTQNDTGETVPSTPASLCAVEPSEDGFVLGIDGSFLAVYQNGQRTQLLSLPVSHLTDYDRALLEAGISLPDEAALRRAIEDYTS